MEQKAPGNGWAFVFLSNESDEPVLFDDFNVAQEHGRISEENHYYPFGLKIAGISSRAAGKLQNSYGYQGDFAENEEETGYDEFDLRMYDGQTGRWTGIDPYDEYGSGYVGMGNSPVNYVDQDGGSAGGWGAVIGGLVGFAAPYVLDAVDKKNNYENKGIYAGLGAILGAGLGYAGFESTFGKDKGIWGTHFRSFYKGLFGKGGEEVYSRFNGYSDPSNLRPDKVFSPTIWEIKEFAKILDERTLLAVRTLGNFIDDYTREYPIYNKTIVVSNYTGKGRLVVEYEKPYQWDFQPDQISETAKTVNISGRPNFTRTIADMTPGVRERHYFEIRKKQIQDEISTANGKIVNIYEVKYFEQRYRVSKAFGVRVPFTRRKIK